MYEGDVLGIGAGKTAKLRFKDAEGRDLSGGVTEISAPSSIEAMQEVARLVTAPEMPRVQGVGYRVVHPGPKINEHVRITPEVMEELRAACQFAPLHDPVAVKIIEATMRQFPDIPHFACFDTVFHQTMPEVASTYALPDSFREAGVRRYGFHGLSFESVVKQMRTAGIRLPQRMVIAHLGSGCSITAVLAGRSVDTTMGLTPLGGVVMGTRPGDLDPGVLFYALRHMKEKGADAADSLEQILNYKCGLVALSALPNDMRGLRKAVQEGNERAKLALAVFTRSVRKAIGAYAWLMHGLDALVFTGGIGENDAASRSEILEGLEDVGVKLDEGHNTTRPGAGESSLRAIHASDSKSRIFIVPAKEDQMIAMHMDRMMQQGS
jgi:acetate kinase